MSDKTNWAVNVYRDNVLVAIFRNEAEASMYLAHVANPRHDSSVWTKKTCAINVDGLVNSLLPAFIE